MKVARTVLRGAALGNKCRLLDNNVLDLFAEEYVTEQISVTEKRLNVSRVTIH
ncbi:hypothetical protein [Vibrio ezurae]|uniref:Uncharacterized protein n=1 Tax=Vibrio ezurae NBRC 102218 TaxID=1219080 RepID=U3CU65_9VIBR|nr:hypothetical protein [Vibrio ezurae]GAD81298.1 hypothetical protein VEZ01S_55_00140 [Vibrio ezurae NBRC 102218]